MGAFARLLNRNPSVGGLFPRYVYFPQFRKLHCIAVRLRLTTNTNDKCQWSFYRVCGYSIVVVE